MSRKASRSAAVLASAAAFSMMATPAAAQSWGWGGGGWGGGWGHRHDHIDAGDVIAGVLIIGGIAAIASAASNASKNRYRNDRRYPDDNRYPDNSRYPDNRDYRYDNRDSSRADAYGSGAGDAMSAAVNRCTSEIDRGKTRVDSVDSVSRDGDGWRVQGRADGNSSFSCSVDGSGRIRQVSIDGHAA